MKGRPAGGSYSHTELNRLRDSMELTKLERYVLDRQFLSKKYSPSVDNSLIGGNFPPNVV